MRQERIDTALARLDTRSQLGHTGGAIYGGLDLVEEGVDSGHRQIPVADHLPADRGGQLPQRDRVGIGAKGADSGGLTIDVDRRQLVQAIESRGARRAREGNPAADRLLPQIEDEGMKLGVSLEISYV